jgi:hypothetical protein
MDGEARATGWGGLFWVIWVIGFLGVVVAWFSTVDWLEGLASAGLSSAGQHSVRVGHSFGTICSLIAILAAGPLPGPFAPARVDPPSNRVLQNLWREPGSIVPGWVVGALLATFLSWFMVSDLIDNLVGGGDRPIGFLAGAGSVFVVAIPAVTLWLLIAKLSRVVTALVRRRATPAPAP